MKFIATRELGRLTRWLCLLGYDAEYFSSDNMKGLFLRAFNESRIVLTKRRKIRSNGCLKVICIRKDLLKDQIPELQKALKQKISEKRLFTRCADCNRDVYKIKKGSVRDLVPPYVFKTQKNFFQCPECRKIFWRATHWINARGYLDEIRS